MVSLRKGNEERRTVEGEMRRGEKTRGEERRKEMKTREEE